MACSMERCHVHPSTLPISACPIHPTQNHLQVDFARPSGTAPAVVERLEYDPNRSAHIALVKHKGVAPTEALRTQYSYFLAPQVGGVGVWVGVWVGGRGKLLGGWMGGWSKAVGVAGLLAAQPARRQLAAPKQEIWAALLSRYASPLHYCSLHTTHCFSGHQGG